LQLNAEVAGAAVVLVAFDEEGLEVVALEDLVELEQAASTSGRTAAIATRPKRAEREKRVLFISEEYSRNEKNLYSNAFANNGADGICLAADDWRVIWLINRQVNH
jgi:hypothetical protein